jgi:hypothetical protein
MAEGCAGEGSEAAAQLCWAGWLHSRAAVTAQQSCARLLLGCTDVAVALLCCMSCMYASSFIRCANAASATASAGCRRSCTVRVRLGGGPQSQTGKYPRDMLTRLVW